MSRAHHKDIRIGTLAPFANGVEYLDKAANLGFESFELTLWRFIDDVDIEAFAKKALEVLDGRAIISSIGIYGNPLQDGRKLP